MKDAIKPKSYDEGLSHLLDSAWSESRLRHGNRLTVHIPGMFVVDGRRGKYRAVSITGDRCDLGCEHCKGSLLKTMPAAETPELLLHLGRKAAERGDHGILITGGCDSNGGLPWKEFVSTIGTLKAETDLAISVHTGQIDLETARALKKSGVDQALVDIIGDDATAREVYHLAEGTSAIRRTMESLTLAGLEIIPHVVFGIHYGRERGETAALEMLREFPLTKYVVVVIMPARGTPMAAVKPPPPEKVAAFLARARLDLPELEASLGCARPRGFYRRDLDVLAVRAGINSLALPSEPALEEAQQRGLNIIYRETCCSL
ncbi:MAG: radical SAM protein [Desulfomonilaceae bacterium]